MSAEHLPAGIARIAGTLPAPAQQCSGGAAIDHDETGVCNHQPTTEPAPVQCPPGVHSMFDPCPGNCADPLPDDAEQHRHTAFPGRATCTECGEPVLGTTQQPTPEAGQKWFCTTETGTRTVTVTRVWEAGDDGHTAVAFEWRDDKPGQCGSALPLGVFLGTYKPELAAAPADPWPTIARLTAWLNDRNGSSTPEITLRILKVQEEAGEVAAAWIGRLGQNPRKGITHTPDDVADELCDVITAAMVALATLKQDPAAHFARKVAQIAALRLDDTAGGEQA